ncbi:beta-3-deoxy-D-manno-oct-2-ulosonic acid transferase [Aquabacterium sp. J223]|uniref:capsular polysaccharide export protein, LipB/KpsS family n=1 Tax=Aquabacterium sp. J223 TaxID=2898431 RepID=UPI0021AE2AD9|nr:beta-3-deoxy-D-manno-oct-2-ulosonic acid transferase [Aquabacterium sp. J223]UUX94133.1 beta-3-deoxy-D-manno-oct-2-ulosonic acid transferase [Aquabacterium sp. J223]
MPAGGLTEDEQAAPPRRRPVALQALVHAALVDYPRYLDPETGRRCAPERLVEWMALQRRMRERFPAAVQAIGFSRWKKPIVRAFLAGSEVTFQRRAAAAAALPGGCVAVWGGRRVAGQAGDGAAWLRLEDGFLRSVGLGADLVRPLSWVVDGEGLYYDATRPSALERLLQHQSFDAALCRRAAALRERLVQAGLSKYNVGHGRWRRPAGATVVLVAGQVEADASIALGAGAVRTNLALLQEARRAHPAAHLVYKPHPDVVAGLRAGGASERELLRCCDEVVRDVPIVQLLDQVDEVHVITSLAGFEALLRQRRVVVHGLPFYAGWGLTEDRMTTPRRSRRLGLDELVAGTLLLYPTYVSRRTGHFTTAERALDELLQWRAEGAGRAPWRTRLLRPLLRRLTA